MLLTDLMSEKLKGRPVQEHALMQSILLGKLLGHLAATEKGKKAALAMIEESATAARRAAAKVLP